VQQIRLQHPLQTKFQVACLGMADYLLQFQQQM